MSFLIQYISTKIEKENMGVFLKNNYHNEYVS